MSDFTPVQFNQPAYQPQQPQQNQTAFLGSSYAPNIPTIAVQSQYRCEIARLTLQETGTYDDQFARPYQTDARTDQVANRIFDVVERTNFSPTSGAFNSVAADLLTVVARVDSKDMISIPNGWGTKRCRFFLEVRETSLGLGNEVYYTFVQGFSDYLGVNVGSGSVDPMIRLYPNTFFRVQEYQEQTPNGYRTAYRVVSSGQVLNGVLTINNEITNTVQFLRPCDVMAGVQRSYDSTLVSGDVLDIRSMNPSGFNTVYSNFANNNPSEYLSRLVTPLSRGSLQVGFGPGHTTFVDAAVTNAMAQEPDVESSVFMRTMQSRLGPVSNSCFTMKDLAELDPTVGQRTNFYPVANNFAMGMSQRGLGGSWSAPTYETVIAAKIMNTLPGLMWEHFIGMISITMSNEFGPAIPMTDNVRLVTKAAPRGMYDRFLAMLTERLAVDISQNNNLKFKIVVNASVLGDISMSVSLNGGAAVDYCAPAFGNGILNPVYSQGTASYDNLVTGISQVAVNIDQVSRNHGTGTTNIANVF